MARRPSGRLLSRWVRLEGKELHFLRSTGPEPGTTPVVLLHGITSGAAFRRVGELVAPHHRVYIPDLPGIGASYKPPEVPGMDALVAVLLAWMDRCELDLVNLAAQSFGCNVAVEVAIEAPERIATLTVQALTLEPGRRSVPRLAAHWAITELSELPRGPYKRRGQQEVPNTTGTGLIRELLQHPIEERLPQVRCPALVLHGRRDHMVSRRWARQAARLLPAGRFREIPQGTHTMNARQPEAYSDALLDFIAAAGPPLTGESHAPERAFLSG